MAIIIIMDSIQAMEEVTLLRATPRLPDVLHRPMDRLDTHKATRTSLDTHKATRNTLVYYICIVKFG